MTAARSEAREPAGVGAAYRRAIELLHRAGGPFTIKAAAEVLGIDEPRTRRLLAYLARRGWLDRIRQGLYTPVPLDASVSGEWTEDAWIAAAAAFAPCYIGGWSALEYWGLNEQLLQNVMVITTRRVRHRIVEMQGTSVRLKVIASDKVFGTTPVWRHRAQILVSDPSRTIVDVLDDPAMGGGINHIAGAIAEYFGSQEHRDDKLLTQYAQRLGNRAVFKRLGYLVEKLGIPAPELVAEARARRSAGLAVLDPSVDSRGHIVRRWGIRANVDLSTVETWA